MADRDDDEMNENVLRAVQKYGLSTVAAIVFGYIIIVDVRAGQTDSRSQHSALVVEQGNIGRGMLKLADKQGETQMLQEKILGVLRSMCVQSAATQADRRDCLKE